MATDYALTTKQDQQVALVDENGTPVPLTPVPLSGANPGADPVFVYRPGGVAGGNVYTTWASLMAAVALVAGPKFIDVDQSIAAPAIPAGTWNLDNCTLTQRSNVPGVLLGGQLTFGAGAKLDPAIVYLRLQGQLGLVNNSGAVVWTTGAVAPIPTLIIEEDSFITGQAGAAFIDVAQGTFQVLCADAGSGVGDTVSAAITVAAGATLNALSNSGAGFVQNAVAGAGTWNLSLGAGGLLVHPQGILPAITYSPVPQVIEAQNLGGLGPAAPVSWTPPGQTIQRSSSGKVRVSGSIAVTGAVGDVVFTLVRDLGGANVTIATQDVSADAGGKAQCTLAIIDTLPDGLAHSYSIVATNAATPLSVAANRANLSADELT
jgi:hypothetical protein